MSTTAIGSIGKQQNLVVRQGADFSFTARLKNPDGTPMDLTGATVRAQMRPTAASSTFVAFTVTILDPLNGRFVIALSAAQTAPLACGESLTDPKSRWAWDLEIQDSLGRVIPLLHGVASVFREVTRG